MKLMIVDDNEDMRRLIRRLMAPFAAEITECDSGSGALACYTAERPDWVLMDIEMGDFDGLMATRQIRAVDPQARILIVTSHDHQSLREAAQRAGALGYMLKENLIEVRTFLQRYDQ